MLRELGEYRSSLVFRASKMSYLRWAVFRDLASKVNALERDLTDHINLGLGSWWEERFIEYLEERLVNIC